MGRELAGKGSKEGRNHDKTEKHSVVRSTGFVRKRRREQIKKGGGLSAKRNRIVKKDFS